MSLRNGNAIRNRKVVDTWSNYYMIQNLPFADDVTVNTFCFYAKRAKKVQLLIYRRDNAKFVVVGKSQMVTASVGVNRVPLQEPIDAKQGDLIGWYVPSTGVIAFDVGTGGWQSSGLEKSTFFTPMRGGETAFKFSSNRVYSIAVEGEPTVKKAPMISIADIFFDGLEKRTEGDEFIEIINTGTAPGNLSGWRINAGDKGQDFTFPKGTTLEPGKSFRVYTNLDDPATGGFKFGSKTAIWNNIEGDVGVLFDASGHEVDEFGYGPMATE